MRRALLLIVVAVGVLLPVEPAAAHPLDQYVLAAYLTPAASMIAVELDLSPGVLVAARALSDVDADGDRVITGAESTTFAERVLAHLQLRADGRPLDLTLTSVDVPPYRTIQAGYGTLRLRATAAGAPTAAGEHELFFRNTFAPPGAAYQVNAVVSRSVAVDHQQRDADQRQSRVEYRLDASAGATRPAATTASTGARRLLDVLGSPSLSGLAVLFALGFALLLGALHALTPGHAKTLMSAYLIGGGATTRHAVTLGAVVTLTHTASVVVIGLVALFASRFLVPGILVPALQILSGLVVLVIGLRLVRHRLRERVPVAHGHSHAPVPRNLVAMGASGGMVPCPEALGVLILAVGVNRTGLGLGLILSFSLGIAAVLMGLGVLLIRARGLVARVERLGSRWTTALPLVSAMVVTALGAGLMAGPFV